MVLMVAGALAPARVVVAQQAAAPAAPALGEWALAGMADYTTGDNTRRLAAGPAAVPGPGTAIRAAATAAA